MDLYGTLTFYLPRRCLDGLTSFYNLCWYRLFHITAADTGDYQISAAMI